MRTKGARKRQRHEEEEEMQQQQDREQRQQQEATTTTDNDANNNKIDRGSFFSFDEITVMDIDMEKTTTVVGDSFVDKDDFQRGTPPRITTRLTTTSNNNKNKEQQQQQRTTTIRKKRFVSHDPSCFPHAGAHTWVLDLERNACKKKRRRNSDGTICKKLETQNLKVRQEYSTLVVRSCCW